MTYEIEVPGYGKVDLSVFAIDDDNILDELSEQPGIYAFWIAQENMAYRDYQEAKLDSKLVRARKHRFYRTEYTWQDVFDKRPTNVDIERLVELDPEYVAAERELIQARFKFQQIKAVRESLQQRKDMLNSVAGTKRSEMAFGQNNN